MQNKSLTQLVEMEVPFEKIRDIYLYLQEEHKNDKQKKIFKPKDREIKEEQELERAL